MDQAVGVSVSSKLEAVRGSLSELADMVASLNGLFILSYCTRQHEIVFFFFSVVLATG